MSTAVNRERILTTLRSGIPDALGIAERVFWPETVDRWRTQGLPAGTSPGEHFGTDAFEFIQFDSSLGLNERIEEETDEWELRRDANGILAKSFKTNSSPPVQVAWTVRNRVDFAAFRDRLAPHPSRLRADWPEQVEAARRSQRVLCFQCREPMWQAMKELLGYENSLMLLAEDPGFIREALERYTELILGMYRIYRDLQVPLDAAWLNSDVCYRGGMLFSPAIYRELVMPLHKRLLAVFKSDGLPVVVHTCGNLREILPLYREAGFTAVHPLEARAGNDLRELKRIYGTDLVFIGNISVESLAAGREEIEAEIRAKVPTAMQGGGYIFHSDHSIPPSVPMANYRYALELVQSLTGVRA